MKTVIAFVLIGFVTTVSGLIAFSPKTTSSVAETVTVSSPKAATESLPLPTNALVSQTKSILKPKVNKDRVLYLNDIVMAYSVKPLIASIKRLNEQNSDPIYLLLDSPGGSVLDGAELISEMEASKAPVYTVCTHICASMAAMIHGHGAKRYGLDRSILMYHPASGGAQGQVRNMLSQLTTINGYIEKMVANLVGKSKMNDTDFQKVVAYELWIDAEDAQAKGLNDAVVNLNVSSQPAAVLELVPNLPQPEEEPSHPEEDKKKAAPKRQFDIQMIAPEHLMYLWDGRNVRKTQN